MKKRISWVLKVLEKKIFFGWKVFFSGKVSKCSWWFLTSGPCFSLSVIYNTAIYVDDTTFYSKCDQTSDLWQHLELASELEFDLQDTGTGSGLLISMLENLNWFCLTGLITLMLLRKNHLLRCWGCIFLLTLSLLLKLPPRKLQPWFVLWSFFLLRLLCISINLPYILAWNTVVVSRLVPIAATWNC